MRALHLISGGDKGGAVAHLFTLLSGLMEEIDVRVVCFMEGFFYQEILKTDIPHALIKQKYRYDMRVIRKLVKMIRDEHFDVIHSHGARANFIAVCLRPFVKIPMITTVHSDYLLDFTENLYKKLLFTEINAISLRFMDFYIAVSNSFVELLTKRGFDPDKVYTVYNAIDFSRKPDFTPKDVFLRENNIPADKLLVGIIGRFEKVKGHEVFLKAAARVLKERDDVMFLLAGDGAERKNLVQLAENLGIAGNVVFTGFLNDIYSFINAIDLNVLSSYSETFPYALLEGAIMRKATVSTDVGGIGDLLIEGETGLLVESGNFEQLAKKILTLVNDDELRCTLGNNLFEYASANFSKENMKKRHVAIYRSAIKRHKAYGRQYDIMLSGYYGFNNSGDDAILNAIITDLRKQMPDIKILVLSKRPREAIDLYGVHAINRYNFYELIKYLKRSRVFVNGGGNLLQDITSTHSLVYYTMLMHLAKYFGMRIMLYANGIGPLLKKNNIRRVRRALSLCDYISFRDPDSLAYLEQMGIPDVNVAVTTDPVFTIGAASDSRIDEIFDLEGIDRRKKYFSLSFRQWRYNDARFTEKVSSAIDAISEEYNLTPLFISMQQPNDFIMNKEIIAGLKTPAAMLSCVYKVDEIMGIISRTEFVIAMRLHTLIYAVSVNIPIIGIIYDAKIKSFMEYINTTSYVDTTDIDVDLIHRLANEIMQNPSVMKAHLARELARLKALSADDAKRAVAFLD